MSGEKDLSRYRREGPPITLKTKEFVKEIKEERLDKAQ